MRIFYIRVRIPLAGLHWKTPSYMYQEGNIEDIFMDMILPTWRTIKGIVTWISSEIMLTGIVSVLVLTIIMSIWDPVY